MLQYFGTDGIRGRAGQELHPELAMRAAYGFARLAAAQQLPASPGRAPRIVIGGDTRLSTPMLRAAVVSGVMFAGCTPVDIGVVPTPVVPWYALKTRTAGGVMITASHNPIEDNGIKFFGADGMKISADTARRIEATIASSGPLQEPRQLRFGSLVSADPQPVYLAFLAGCCPAPRVDGSLRIVLDSAYGATGQLAPQAFGNAGYELLTIHSAFDGARVNVACGATDTRKLQRRVTAVGADLGLAFDGDGDRVLAVDHLGEPVDGDRLIALLATHHPRYRKQGAVVMTHMSNLGVEQALAARGITMLRTDVGDSLVLEELVRRGLDLGGEQSGHIILRDKLPTGDGILAGLQVAQLVRRLGRPLRELVQEFPVYPQQLTNVKVHDLKGWMRDRQFLGGYERLRSQFSDVRFYLRASGTEKCVRVLTEARDAQRCQLGNRALCTALTAWDAGK